MKRRAFLGLTAAGVTMPAFLAQAFAQDGERSAVEPLEKLNAALLSARAAIEFRISMNSGSRASGSVNTMW